MVYRIAVPAITQALYQIENRTAALRIDSHGRLVEYQELRLMENSAGEVQASLHSAREGTRELVGAWRQTHGVKGVFHSKTEPVPAQIVHPSPEIEVLASSQIRVQSDRLRDDTNQGPRGRPCVDIDAVDCYFARIARENSGNHRDRGGLAGPVGSEQTVDFTRVDREADVIDSDSLAEAFSEPAHLEHCRHNRPFDAGFEDCEGFSQF